MKSSPSLESCLDADRAVSWDIARTSDGGNSDLDVFGNFLFQFLHSQPQ